MSRARVLIADDNDEILETVTELLTSHFDLVGAVTDGESLVKAARSLHPDVLVLDISMPVLNGIQAVTHLKAQGSEAKVVFLTIHNDAEFVTACFAVGAKAYVLKTRLVSDLVHAIDETLADRSFVSLLPLHHS
jgi:DNA-binding NarL/FixJ family response regulator